MQGQIPVHLVVLTANMLDVRARKGDGGILLHVKEGSGSQVGMSRFHYRELIARLFATHVVNKGIEGQEIRFGVDADEVASILIATLEGAIVLSNLYKDSRHMKRAAEHILHYIETMRFSGQ